MPKRLAPLLPAENGTEHSPFDSPREDPSKRKRVGTEIACNACRRRKTRCDGIRPACAACRKRSTECIFVERRENTKSSQSPDGSQEVLELLRSAPESQAFEILRLLRANGDFSAVLSIVRGGSNGLPRPSEQDTARAVRGQAQSSLELELMAKSPVSYPPLRNVPLTTGQRETLLRPNRLRRSRSFDHQGEKNGQNPSPSSESRPATGQAECAPHPDDRPSDLTPPNWSPGSDHDLCDSRLKSLKIGFWTDVAVSDEYAARVISLYLRTDHPLLGVFDAQLFISDLVQHQTAYCCRLLVNSLMYWGCQMYTAIDERASHYAEAFCAEAEKLWLCEQDNDTILNAASAQLLSLAYLGHGKDHYVLKYLAMALSMGKRLNLFGVEPSKAVQELERIPPETQRANSYTAWGIFNWGVLTTLFYQQPGLEYPDYPPVYPVPGDPTPSSTPDTADSFGSDVSEGSLPSFMGRTLPILCKFWHIMHGVTLQYYKDRSSPILDHVSLDYAEFKFRELLAWMESLSPDLVLGDHCPHHVVVFHTWFHAAVLDIFRPFIRQPRGGRYRLKTFTDRGCTPDAAFNASVKQLKQLVVRFRCNYKSSSYTLLWQSALIYVANAVLHDTDDPEWRFYFLTCIYGYESLRPSYRIAEVISRGLLAMTLRDGDMSGPEARHLLQEMKDTDGNDAAGDIRATFMVDLDLAMTDPEAARVENLAERFEDIALFRDFTTVDDDEARNFRRMESVDSD
ncbi:Conidial development protein fluffy [Colletotrichum sidae]|uniref:Conidial development protein fluffy n=1 Tax=Colletotrichum sidae TaxID=1347389 RepID=A0A4R8TAH2_9PEZI|nr:Conidial development protein fluffy [Colletotrichum sidae]